MADNVASSAASNPTATVTDTTDGTSGLLQRQSTDIAWEYGFLRVPGDMDKVGCKLCGHQYCGGASRIKKHIAGIKGDVKSCPKATPEDKARCKAAIDDYQRKKKEKKNRDQEIREEVNITSEEGNEFDEDEVLGSRKRPNYLGPMDQYVKGINPKKRTRQQNINDAIFKDRTSNVDKFLARWVYEAGIPFHAIDNEAFRQYSEAVGQFGPGYQPASQYKLRESLLKSKVERTKTLLKKQEEEWALTGCSVMTDAWSDRKRRSIMNLCVNCKQGTCFISSKEDSEASHTGLYIFEYVDNYIEAIGAEKVVQVVTDNASNNMAAADLLKIKRPNIFWTSCATHTVNLMLEGIGKLQRFKKTLDLAKAFTIYIYSHHNTLGMMRRFTKNKEIVKPGVTRFATAFLTLQSLDKIRVDIRAMFGSAKWEKSKWFKKAKGKTAYATATSMAFWNGITFCLNVFEPLVMVLRLVDGDKPAMGFVYGELQKAREEIKKAFKNVETNYRPILEIIDKKSKDRLDSPLHLVAYFLNPFYFFKDSTIQDDPLVMDAMYACVEAFFPDNENLQNEVMNKELLKYKKKEGPFGRSLALRGCATNDESYDPVGWWSNYGNHTPNLKKMAIRILSLTASSSGCERNWSTFEGIHTKKRNRLDATRLNNLVYVQFNSKLLNNKKRKKEKDVLLSNESTHAQGWLVKGGDDIDPITGLPYDLIGEALGSDEYLEPRRSARNAQVRDVDEDDFLSDSESEEEVDDMDIEFVDDEQVVEVHGIQEEEL